MHYFIVNDYFTPYLSLITQGRNETRLTTSPRRRVEDSDWANSIVKEVKVHEACVQSHASSRQHLIPLAISLNSSIVLSTYRKPITNRQRFLTLSSLVEGLN